MKLRKFVDSFAKFIAVLPNNTLQQNETVHSSLDSFIARLTMTDQEVRMLHRFRALLEERIQPVLCVAFGSRARGDADPESDFDVLVVVEELTPDLQRFISDCAYEASFDDCIVLAPIVYSRAAWFDGPERSSLLADAIAHEGIAV